MITQGFRELIINSESVVSDDGTDVTIENIGTFIPGTNTVVADNLEVASEDAVAGEYNIALLPTTPVADEDVTIEIFLTLPGRTLSELFPEPVNSVDFTVRGDGTTAIEVLLLNQIITGFNDKIFIFTAGGAGTINVVFQPGYEGVGVAHVHSTITAGDLVKPTVELSVAETTAPNAGLNIGKDLEANVRLATGENQLYGYNPHGQGMIIDPRAKYTAFTITTTAPLDGWERHSAMGNQDVNQQLNYKTFSYIFYVNEASAPLALVSLQLLTP